MAFYLVHWVNEGSWDVYDQEKASMLVPEEVRYEGALGLMTWEIDGKEYLGRVRKVSYDVKEIEAEEQILMLEIKEAKEKVVEGEKRKTRKTQVTGKATEKAVSKALGEKPKLSVSQMALRRKAADEKKKKANAQKVTEQKEDAELFKGVSRNLEKHGAFGPSTSGSRSNVTVDLLSDEENAEGDESDVETKSDAGDNVLESNRKDEDDDQSGDDSDVEMEPHLKDFKNPNTEGFLNYLLLQFGSRPRPGHQVYATPIEIPGHKMVRLKKGFTLKINKGSRNVLVVDKKGQKVASAFARKVLTSVYGADQLSRCTALGRKKDSMRIADQDLSAIYAFVSEYSSDKNFTWDKFMTAVMKKCAAEKSPKPNKAGKDITKMNKDNCKGVVASPRKFQKTLTVTTIECGGGGQECQTASKDAQSKAGPASSTQVGESPKTPRKSPGKKIQTPQKSPGKKIQTPQKLPGKKLQTPQKSPGNKPKTPPKAPSQMIGNSENVGHLAPTEVSDIGNAHGYWNEQTRQGKDGPSLTELAVSREPTTVPNAANQSGYFGYGHGHDRYPSYPSGPAQYGPSHYGPSETSYSSGQPMYPAGPSGQASYSQGPSPGSDSYQNPHWNQGWGQWPQF